MIASKVLENVILSPIYLNSSNRSIIMENNQAQADPTPPECFKLAELEILQSFESQELIDVNYYLWINAAADGAAPYRFLYAIELLFDNYASLLLSSGEDTEAIRVITAAELLETARALQTLHGKITIERAPAAALPLWQSAAGHMLLSINLSKTDEGLYLNDALLLNFGAHKIMVQLSDREGLAVGVYG